MLHEKHKSLAATVHTVDVTVYVGVNIGTCMLLSKCVNCCEKGFKLYLFTGNSFPIRYINFKINFNVLIAEHTQIHFYL